MCLIRADPHMPSTPYHLEHDGIFMGIDRSENALSVILFDDDKPDVHPNDISLLRAMSFEVVLVYPKDVLDAPYTNDRLLRNLVRMIKEHMNTRLNPNNVTSSNKKRSNQTVCACKIPFLVSNL